MTSFNVPLLASAALLPPPTLRFDGVAFNQQGKALLGPCSFTLDGTGPTPGDGTQRGGQESSVTAGARFALTHSGTGGLVTWGAPPPGNGVPATGTVASLGPGQSRSRVGGEQCPPQDTYTDRLRSA